MLEFVAIRSAVTDDAPFIIDTWQRSFKEYWDAMSVPKNFKITKMDYQLSQRKRIADSLRLGKTLVACDRQDQSIIFGWICYQGQLVHYLYVRKDARVLSIEDDLLAASGFKEFPVLTSHWFSAMRGNPDRYTLDLFRRGG